MFIDTHCHLDDLIFNSRLPQVLWDAAAAGVTQFIVPGVDAPSWRRMVMLPKGVGIFPAYGLHPLAAESYADAEAELERYAPEGVAIGEIGLDYLLEVPRSIQQETFRSQLRLAKRLELPVLIHCRRAFEDLLRILDEEAVSCGVMHAFSGSVEVARQCVTRGFYVSVAGPVTYSNAERPRQVVEAITLDRLLLETDSPDLAPHPHRGEPNKPSLLPLIAAEVARIRNVPVAEVARVTTENARRVFRWNK